jgi:CBS domain-containing protein
VLIEQILASKGADVASISPAASVVDAVATLRERNIGALVVCTDDGELAGILSERDVVRALADGAGVLDRTVGDLMTTDVATCERRAAIEELMGLMTDRRIRHVPVIDDGALVGIVSIGDVVKARMGELEAEASTLHEYITQGR